MNCDQVLEKLRSIADPETVRVKRERFGIVANRACGVYLKDIKALDSDLGENSDLAIMLFDSGIYEARMLCSKIFDPALLTDKLMEQWVQTFENWEICDIFCMGFFAKSSLALTKAAEWSERDEEFVKRAGFVLMACYGFADKKADNEIFRRFFPIIEREVNDDRLYVKKAVNWALRNIGKRNVDLLQESIAVAEKIVQGGSKSARWIGRNALNELTKPDVKIFDYPRAIYR